MKIRSVLFLVIFFLSCSENYTPKPRAFFKLEFPEKIYIKTDIDCPFQFDKPIYSKLEQQTKKCFYNLIFPDQEGILHITYLALNNDLQDHTEESRALALKHISVADEMKEDVIVNEADNVYGVLYDYRGMTATSTQFYLTDSINHFFRGALYFNTEINDSLLPINNFLKEDVKKIIESFKWKIK